MSKLLELVEKSLIEDEWPYQKSIEEALLHTGFQGNNGNWNCLFQILEDKEIILFYSLCPFYIPENKRSVVADFITRVNFGLLVGNFELDFSDGEIRYKTSIDVENMDITTSAIKNLIYANIITMDKYLPGIMKVAHSNVTAEQAFNAIESERITHNSPTPSV